MSRRPPSLQDLDAIARAFDRHDAAAARYAARRVRDLPVMVRGPWPEPCPSLVSRLRGIHADLARALEIEASFERDLTIASIARRVGEIADRIEAGDRS